MKGKKTGGRQKGSVNKTTAINKKIITSLLSSYEESGLMAQDWMDLEAKDRLTLAEKFMQYIMPKMQSTAVDINAQDRQLTIEDKLKDLCKEG